MVGLRESSFKSTAGKKGVFVALRAHKRRKRPSASSVTLMNNARKALLALREKLV